MLKISGTTSEHCENAVKRALTEVDGVDAAVREEGYEVDIAE
jgi:copper chaperone CopZ